jgi:putative glutamine amidotransferase
MNKHKVSGVQKKLLKKPIVLIPADVKQIGEHAFHAVGQKYILAVAQAAQATPLLIPAVSEYLSMDDLLASADGILFTGSPANVHPSHFGQAVHNAALPLDPARDALTLQLIRAAIDMGVPVLAICRGFQELNVAYGGSLYQAVQEQVGKSDHREPKDLPLDTQYAVSHSINIAKNSHLESILGAENIMVNSLHGQGIDRLGAGLSAQAYAPDGLIEAIGVDNAEAFVLGVQWHPEWKVMESPESYAIFKAFGEACKARMLRRIPPD